MLSMVAAALLLVGCGEKKEQKSEASKPAKSVEKTVKAPEAKSSVATKEKITEPLPGTPMPAPVKEEKAASSVSSSEATVTQKVQESVESVKKEVTKKIQEAKEKVSNAAKAALGAGGAAATNAGGDVAKGKELFAKCASCHGPDGKRKALGKSGIIAGMPKDEVLKKLKGYKAGSLNQYGMGMLMKGQVGSLSESDLEALAAYISSLK